jgi:uncharacterized membrane protein YecN with MAPEG domain
MNSLALAVYAACWVVLFAKFVLTITLMARARMRARTFRYAEDASFWHGHVADDPELAVRAQRLLANDAESQTYFLALGGAYLALGAWPAGSAYYFVTFTAARVVHAYCLLRARQPARNRAFAVGLGVLGVLAGHVAVECGRALFAA